MRRNPAEILKEALDLPVEARAALVGSLLESLDPEVDLEAERAWEREIRSRIEQLDSGAVSTDSWSEVRSRLMSALTDAR